MINILSDNLLLLGYARGDRRLTPSMVRECFEDLKLEYPAPVATPESEPAAAAAEFEARESSRSGFWTWALVGLLAVLLGVAAFFFRDDIMARVKSYVAVPSEPNVSTLLVPDSEAEDAVVLSFSTPAGEPIEGVAIVQSGEGKKKHS